MQLDNLLTDNSRQPTIRFCFCVIMPLILVINVLFYYKPFKNILGFKFSNKKELLLGAFSQMDAIHSIRQTMFNEYH